MVRIICEGKEDKNKIIELLKFLDKDIEVNDNNFTVMNSKSNLLDKNSIEHKALLNNIANFKKILFIVDADYWKNDNKSGGYENTEDKIKALIKGLEIKGISDYYICCDPKTKEGFLESLLLSTVDENLKKCYVGFLDCIDHKKKEYDKHIMEQLHRITSPDKPYDFEHQNFCELKGKLVSLFEISTVRE